MRHSPPWHHCGTVALPASGAAPAPLQPVGAIAVVTSRHHATTGGEMERRRSRGDTTSHDATIGRAVTPLGVRTWLSWQMYRV
ncbi:hypothetical protein BT93_I0885 [Corymbia citriodora subsp. variegata]|nr:hypothetical protein BT93_I0885 [Corymbia citriodora subsp. variegata]